MEATFVDLADNPNAGKTIPFLDLPARYNLWVYDILHFNFSDPEARHSQYALADYTSSAGTLLVSKIIDALRDWDPHGRKQYTDNEISNVGGLAERNTHTCHSAQVESEVDKVIASMGNKPVDIPRLMVDLVLQGFFDNRATRNGVVNINSNEPVLLVNFDDGDRSGRLDATGRDMLNYVVNIVVADLQSKWNVLPVRVYAGAFLPLVPSESRHEAGQDTSVPSFSITLLNVVNTDIGGPSMPQLLDAYCEAAEWNRVMRTEVWRERELVSREDCVDAGSHIDDASEHSFESEDGDNESVGSDAACPAILTESLQPDHEFRDEELAAEEPSAEVVEVEQQQDATEPRINPESAEQLATQHEDVAAAPTETDNDHQDDSETENEEQPQDDYELPERNIDHPSWERHDDSTSLLDLIRSQVSMIAPFGTGHTSHGAADLDALVTESTAPMAEFASRSARVESAPVEDASAKSSSEDEFVVV